MLSYLNTWRLLRWHIWQAQRCFSLIIAAVINGQPLVAAVHEALTGKYYSQNVFAVHFSVLGQATKTLDYFLLNFPTPLAILASLGIYWAWQNLRQRWFALFAGCIFIVNFVFAYRYPVADAYKFFTPDFVIYAMFVGVAVPHMARPSPVKSVVFCLLAILPIAVYEVAPEVLRREGVPLGTLREIPSRDSYVYFIRPRKNGEDSAERYARAALASGPQWSFVCRLDD